MTDLLTSLLHVSSAAVIAISSFFAQTVTNHHEIVIPPLKSPTTEVKREIPATSTDPSSNKVKTATTTKALSTLIGPKLPASSTIPSKNKTTATVAKEITKTTVDKSEKIHVALNTEVSQKPLPPLSQVNTDARSAVVNILCSTAQDGGLRPLSGSGMIIDDRGVVITNAHIGQYFLLRDFPQKNNVDCIIRTGAPARAMYRGELLFISPPWIEANRKSITEDDPTGTGENDFALILITSTVNSGDKLPATFPHVSYNTDDINGDTDAADNFVIVGYPAGFLGSLDIYQNLYISSTATQLKKLYTFKERTVDLLSFGGSVMAQKGASGGGVVRQKDEALVGLVVTTTEAATTGARDLHAISISHVNRSIEASTNKTLAGYLLGNINETLDNFQKTKFPYLKNILVNELTS